MAGLPKEQESRADLSCGLAAQHPADRNRLARDDHGPEIRCAKRAPPGSGDKPGLGELERQGQLLVGAGVSRHRRPFKPRIDLNLSHFLRAIRRASLEPGIGAPAGAGTSRPNSADLPPLSDSARLGSPECSVVPYKVIFPGASLSSPMRPPDRRTTYAPRVGSGCATSATTSTGSMPS